MVNCRDGVVCGDEVEVGVVCGGRWCGGGWCGLGLCGVW